MSGIWRGYIRLLEKRPLITTALQTGAIMATGDAIAQKLIERKPQLEIKRSARFFCFGAFFGGPVLRGWYGVLDKVVKPKNANLAALGKVSFDQLFFAPCFLTAFLGIMGLAKGDSTEDIKQKYKQNFVDILIANYKLWPAVQLVNFYFVPLQHRVMVVNFTALFWNTYLAWKSERDIDAIDNIIPVDDTDNVVLNQTNADVPNPNKDIIIFLEDECANNKAKVGTTT
ncbi:unnamed protein product [Owenia fusiformis]|uniref:Mitochondrial inner membrane protein Mpv17 n=1 Tax=Owenia fusiformis TaxID=6347 RepID=A0A8J1U9Y1_OWEFU|nr:unnamed protein product [Owenia fusiformis]